MSKLFATTQDFNLAELSAISLAAARQERYYKGSLLGVVLLPVCLLFYPYIDFWFSNPGQFVTAIRVQSIVLIIVAACFIVAALVYLLHFCLSPLNSGCENQFLRKNEAGWWLGAGSQWDPVDLTGEALITYWLIILRIRLEGARGSRYLWLWQDAVGANTHRKLRLLLRQ